MSYKYVSEDEKSYTIKGADNNEFKVAKRGLSKRVLEKIDMMKPQTFADGGIVNDPKEALGFDPFKPVDEIPHLKTKEETNKEELDKIIKFNEAANPGQDPLLREQMALRQIQRGNLEKDGQEIAARKSQEDRTSREAETASLRAEVLSGKKPPSVGDLAATEQQSAIDSLKSLNQPVNTGIVTPSQTSSLGDFNSAMDQMTKGFNSLAQSQGQQGAQTAQAYADYSRQMDQINQRYQANFQTLEDQRQKLTKDIEDGKIDPGRLWTSMSSGNKAMAVIGLVLSGIGSGVRGTQNEGLKILDNMINRDIEAQKTELGKKQNLLSENLRTMGNLQQAEQMTRLQMIQSMETRVKQIAAGSMSDQAKANADIALAKIRTEIIPLQQKLSAAMTQNQMTQSNPIAAKIQALPENVRQEAWKELGEYQNIKSNIKRAGEVMDEAASYTAIGKNITSPIQSAELRKTAFGKLFPIAKAIAGERMTDSDARNLVEPFLPTMTDSAQTIEKKKRALIEGLEAQIAARTPRLSGYGILPQEKTINFTPVKGK